MATFVEVSGAEMEAFLIGLEFRSVEIPNCREQVYGKRIDQKGIPLTIRVYTGIVSGKSRECGADAIRVAVFTRTPNGPVMLSGSKRVHRVQGWKRNLQERIDGMLTSLRICKCGKPMAVRTGKDGEFFGCTGYPVCRRTESV